MFCGFSVSSYFLPFGMKFFDFSSKLIPLILCNEICTVKTSDQSQRWTIVIYDQYFCNISDIKRALLPKAHPFFFNSFFSGFHLRFTILFVFYSPVVLTLADVTTVLWLPAACSFFFVYSLLSEGAVEVGVAEARVAHVTLVGQ